MAENVKRIKIGFSIAMKIMMNDDEKVYVLDPRKLSDREIQSLLKINLM